MSNEEEIEEVEDVAENDCAAMEGWSFLGAIFCWLFFAGVGTAAWIGVQWAGLDLVGKGDVSDGVLMSKDKIPAGYTWGVKIPEAVRNCDTTRNSDGRYLVCR